GGGRGVLAEGGGMGAGRGLVLMMRLTGNVMRKGARSESTWRGTAHVSSGHERRAGVTSSPPPPHPRSRPLPRHLLEIPPRSRPPPPPPAPRRGRVPSARRAP